MIELVINGEKKQVAAGMTLLRLVSSLGVTVAHVIVEHNAVIVPFDNLDRVLVSAGDIIEVIHLAGGGSPNWEV